MKILCVGRNYVDHAKELGSDVPPEPLFFLKPPSAVIGDGDAIVRPKLSQLVHHEGELAVVIGARLKDAATEADALRAVRGYTCANDVTARDLQKKDGQWTRAKGFDTFCPLGPRVVPLAAPQNVQLTLRVNGAVRQQASTASMIFSIGRILVDASRVMTLEPGDVILTGTPAGVGPLVAGDVVEVEIEGVGVLHNPVRDST